MTRRKPELLQGTLDLLILKALMLAPQHGWGLAKRIEQLSREVLLVQQGSLYPALYRLEDDGLITGEWHIVDGRRIKVYRATRAGAAQFEREAKTWRRFSGAVDLILATER